MSSNCAQRLLYNGSNLVRNAVLAASSVLPAERTVRVLPALANGSAGVSLSGAYAGEADGRIDIEIVDTTPTSPIISAPVFVGVGTGKLSALSFSGDAQKFTLNLIDAGNEAARASVAYSGGYLEARALGAAGNGITFECDDSGLTYTPLNFSLIAALPKDTRRSTAAGLDWNTAVMPDDDQFPAAAKRIVFGNDRSQVYRQAKQWTGSKWEYVFDPPLKRAVNAGERISEVTGTYSVTIDDGVAPETYGSLVTDYDFLTAVNSESSLVQFNGVIANDRAEDGQAIRELTLRTKAYALPVEGNGSVTAQAVQLESVVVNDTAATGLIEARCWATSSAESPNAHLGAEIWEVSDLTGFVGNFKTGDTITNDAGDWSFVIPKVYPNGYGTARGEFSIISIDPVSRSGDAEPPQICPVALALGPAAVDQTITLVYTKRPADDCSCEGLPIPDLQDNDCLMGPNNPNSPGANTVSYPGAITTRMTNLWQWVNDLARDYTQNHALTTDTPSVDASENGRLADAKRVAALLERTAIKVAGSVDALALWDDCFADAKLHFGSPFGVDPLEVGENISADRFVKIIDGKVYLATSTVVATTHQTQVHGYTVAGLTLGDPVDIVDLTVPSGYVAQSGLTAGHAYDIDPANPGELLDLDGSGNTSGPGFASIAVRADLLSVGNYLNIGNPTNGFDVIVDRYQAATDAILASAGISPLGKSDASTVSDDGCWQDIESENYYWAVTGSSGGGYQPAFTNVPYFSSRRVGNTINSTREFAFQINVKPDCVAQLKRGDTIRLAIGAAAWPSTYQVGDTLYLPIIAERPLELVGGVNASLDQVWSVNGSVNGPLEPFTAANGSGSYSDGGLEFTLTAGGIRFAKGDTFKFDAEGGHFRWRQDGGAWSSPLDIAATPITLADGLAVTFAPGAAPSFVAADRHDFAVRQPNAVANVKVPTPHAWRWEDDTATLDIDLGSLQSIDSFALGLHNLPAGADISITGGTTVGDDDVFAAITLPWARTIAKLWETPVAVRWIRVTVADAEDGAIGWIYAGAALSTETAADTAPRRDYLMDRGNGRNASGRLLGSGQGGSINWPEASLTNDEADEIADMLDWVKAAGDEPIVWFPNATHESEGMLVRVDGDSIEFNELQAMRPSDAGKRLFELRLSLSAVLQ